MKLPILNLNFALLIMLYLASGSLQAETSITSMSISSYTSEFSLGEGFVVIKSTPSGAEVFIGDKTTGKKTPFQMQLDAGTYRFMLKLPMYRDFESEIIIVAGQTITKEINLKPAYGSINVTSEPSEALITLDGILTNERTPYILDKIPSGTHIISLSRDMYSDVSQRIEVNDEQVCKVFLELQAGYGTIGIVTKPEAAINIDGNFTATGNYAGRLSPGMHLLEVLKDKYYTQKKEIIIISGQELKLNFQLEPKLGSISVMCEPVETEIFLDNSLIGNTPKIVQGISVGEHILTLKKEGYVDNVSKITIKENQTLPISINLEKTLSVSFQSVPSDATIYINGNYGGTTPIRKTLGPGIYSVTLERKFYVNNSINVSISHDTSFTFTLKSAIDHVNITTNPGRVHVFIDDEHKGTTPLTVDIIQGSKVLMGAIIK